MRRAAALLCIALLLTGCGEEVEVRVVTQVFADGGLQRALRIDARDPARTEPYPSGWLASGPGIVLAHPSAWDSVETSATALRAEGHFSPGEAVPPLLAHRGEEGDRPDRGLVSVTHQDLVVLDRFTYEEILGDPYGAQELTASLDALLGKVAARLSEVLRTQFGPELATASTERFVTKGARTVLLDVLTALKETEPSGKRAARASRLEKVHVKHGLPAVSNDPDHALEADVQALIERVAAELARANPRMDSAVLTAFVAGEEGALSRILEEPDLKPETDAVLSAMVGAYGLGARTRFVCRVSLPGRVLRTNGTLEKDSAVFVFDQDTLSAGDTVLRVESVEPNTDALVRLGARRELDAAALLRLVELLTRPDLEEPLRAALARAVETGRFTPLREGDSAAAEVADILDPGRPAWPPD